MVLSGGARVGTYEILAPLGAGGMGEVYRARDTALNREVAIKVLPEAFAGDANRLARFSREAQTLAALNHPNIAQIHGLEASGPVHALIMELVVGEDLSALIARGPISPADALPLARQIVAALEAAHGLGIVHRDLKPANIKVRHDGTLKVLDFGLAKAMEPAGAPGGDAMNSPTITARGTELGTILGTAAYMAPEQAKGRPVDTRADIWAFGVIVFEMLTGKTLFAGETISDTLAAVLRDEIRWTALPVSTPNRIRRLLERCLDRDVTMRLQAIGEARIVLDATDEPAGVVRPGVPRQPRASVMRKAAPWGAAALAVVAAAAGGWWLARASTPAPVVSRLSVTLPVPLSPNHETANVALSRDGRTLAYVGVHNGISGLYVRTLDQHDARLLAGTERAAGPVFSPDGAWLAYKADGRMKKVPVLGGSPAVVNEGNPDTLGADWAPDGTLLFARGFTLGLARVAASGGVAQVLMRPDPAKGESSYLWPRLLPGGNDLLYVINPDSSASFNDARIAMQPLGGNGVRTMLDARGSFPFYVPTGHLVFFSNGSVRAAPFDLRQRALTGPAAPVVDGVSVAPHTGAVQAAISDTGTLAYADVGDQVPRSSLVALDANGRPQSLTEMLPVYFGELSLSADGQRVAIRLAKANDDIHVLDIARGSLTRFTHEGGDEQTPIWTPDGTRIAYSSQRGGALAMYWKASEGGTPEAILTAEHPQRPSSFSPDGKVLAYTELREDSGADIWTVRLDSAIPRQPELFLRTALDEDLPLFSPDGRWLAYRSNESGRTEVYVARFPGAAVKRQVSIDGGDQPQWGADGRQLFYVDGTRLMSVDMNTESGLPVGKPRMLFERAPSESALNSGGWGHTYAVRPDGKGFLFVSNATKPEVRELKVVLNWFEDLKRRVP
jgi:eukaryotic-like serine/threonine-protein kinase